MSLKELKREISKKEEELRILKAELESKEIEMTDIVPYAIFDIIPKCQDIMVLIPMPSGEFALGGVNKDFKQYWSDKNFRNATCSFTRQECFDKLRSLSATKSSRTISMSN